MEEITDASCNSKRPKPLLVALLVFLLVGVVLMLAARTSAPARISVQYLGRVDRPGSTHLRLAITNIGTSLAFISSTSKIQTIGNSNRLLPANRGRLDILRPGDGMITQCLLSDEAVAALDGRWRVACYYYSNGIRSWIEWWRWHPGRLGPKVNWLILNFPKGRPLTLIGTSEWNEPAPASSNAR